VLALEKGNFSALSHRRIASAVHMTIFATLGVLPALRLLAFRENSARNSNLATAPSARASFFRQGKFNREPEAIQVERATFDHVFAQARRASGADVREGWSVTKTISDDDA